jgi:hypothetical protein
MNTRILRIASGEGKTGRLKKRLEWKWNNLLGDFIRVIDR